MYLYLGSHHNHQYHPGGMELPLLFIYSVFFIYISFCAHLPSITLTLLVANPCTVVFHKYSHYYLQFTFIPVVAFIIAFVITGTFINVVISASISLASQPS